MAAAAGLAWADGATLYREAVDKQRAGDLATAVELYRECLREDGERLEARVNLGASLSGLGRYDEAIAEYQEALRKAPAEIRPLLERNIGLAYDKANRPEEAARVFDDLVNERPEDATVRTLASGAAFHAGVSAFAAGEYPRAVKRFARAQELNAEIPRLHSYLGLALLFTGDAGQAEAEFRQELAKEPADFPANFYLGQILASRGMFAEAAPLYRSALKARPEAAEVRKALAEAEACHFDRSLPQPGGPLPGEAAPALSVEGWRLPLPVEGKPAVLLFGSYTCPNFRSAAPALNRLAERYGQEAGFLLVYIREAHAEGDWQSTVNEAERIELKAPANNGEKHGYAEMCARKLKLGFATAVDGMEGAAEKAYAAWPSRIYIIGKDGRVRYSSGMNQLEFDEKAVERAIQSVL